jgi:CRP-like cAMP-binding protein
VAVVGGKRRSELLCAVSSEDEAAAESLLASCSRQIVGAGETLDAGHDAALIVVEDGLIVVRSATGADARPLVTCDAGVGSILPGPREGEAVAAVVRSAITIVPTDARDRFLELPSIARTVTDQLQRAARRAREQAEIFVSKRNIERVRRRLLQLARDHGRVTRTGVRLEFPLTHELLAAMIGSARESVTRALDELEREGFLQRDGRYFVLLVTPDVFV